MRKLEHEGVIFRIEKGKAHVDFIQTSACSGCHAKSICSMSEKKEKTIEIPDIDESFHVGDKVIIVGETSWGLLAVLYAFIIPLVLMIATLVIFHLYVCPETLSALSALILLVLYYMAIYLLRDKFKKKFVFKIFPLKEN